MQSGNVSRLCSSASSPGRSSTDLKTVSCYSAPETHSIFVNDGAFKFELRGPLAVPALLHATSGARAIGLRHYTLVKFEKPIRSPGRRALHGLAQHPQIIGQPGQLQGHVAHALHLPFFHNQGHWGAHALQNGNLPPPPAALGPVWINPLPAPPHVGLLGMVAPTSQPQGQFPSSFIPWNPQPVASQWGLHYHVLQAMPVGGGSQQGTSQSLGQNNPVQQAPQNQNIAQQTLFGGNSQSGSAAQQSFLHGLHQYQSILGGSMQPTTPGGQSAQNTPQYLSPYGGSFQSAPGGQPNNLQRGSHQQSIFGGSFHSNSVGQQNASHSNTTNQLGQTFNPYGGLAPVIGSATSSTVVLLNHVRASLRMRMPDGDTDDDIDKYFYINTGSDYFKLRIGEPTAYSYPTYRLTQFPHTLTPVSAETRQVLLQDLQQAYATPTSFPQAIKLPGLFAHIQHLLLKLELAPCLAPMRSDGFKRWLHIETANFCETTIKSTLVMVPNVKNLDLLIEGDSTCRTQAHEKMVLRHFKKAPIQEENGIQFGQAELGLLEMEIRVWIMSQYMGKHGPEGPEVRIVVRLPQSLSESRC
jgi:hypothetical protein